MPTTLVQSAAVLPLSAIPDPGARSGGETGNGLKLSLNMPIPFQSGSPTTDIVRPGFYRVKS